MPTNGLFDGDGVALQPPPSSLGAAAGGVHTPSEPHTAPDAQSEDVAHFPKQLPVDGSHRYGAHDFGASPLVGTLAVPASSHLAVIGTHLPLTQLYVSAQSDLSLHDVLHAAPSHAYAPHEILSTLGVHAPLPSQRPRGVRVPSTHEASPHSVSGPETNPAHFVRFDGLHSSALHGSPPPSEHFSRAPCGSPEIGEQVPSAPGTSHASH